MNLNDTVVMMVAENSVVPFPSSLFLDVHYTIDTTTPFISLEEQSWLQSTLFNQGATYSPLPGQSPLLLLNPTLWSTQFPNITHVLTLNTLPEFRVLDLNEASTSLPPSSSSSSNTDTITSTSPSSSSAKPSPIAVTPQWVYDCIKTKKRINEFYYSSYDKDVFSGWVIALVDVCMFIY
ncbi:hypothetical protein HMI55_001627 [Coelomomyces lativittatus]|nr:hypothetical protein HMI55_001627 [Coelomomyces lativittatus]